MALSLTHRSTAACNSALVCGWNSVIVSELDGAFIKKCFVDRSVIKITIGESVGVSVDDIIKKVGEVAQKNKLTHKFEKTRLGLCVVFEKEENVDWVVVVRDFAVLFSGVDVG